MKPVAIPTRYNGTRFRSRLEASWAEWLDSHEIAWAYEAQGFRFGSSLYLPDFWLPELRTVLEVKGILDPSLDKVFALAEYAATKDVPVLVGMAPPGVRLGVAHPSPSLWAHCYGHNDTPDGDVSHLDGGVVVWRCERCGKNSLTRVPGDWNCRVCNSWSGRILHEFEPVHTAHALDFAPRG